MTASEKNLSEISGTSGAGGTNGTTGKSAAAVNNQELAEIVSANLKKLIAQNGIYNAEGPGRPALRGARLDDRLL